MAAAIQRAEREHRAAMTLSGLEQKTSRNARWMAIRLVPILER